MKVFSLALLGVCGCFGFAASAHADDAPFGDGFGFREGRARGGSFVVEPGARPFRAPRGSIVVEPVRARPPRVVEPSRRFGPGVGMGPVRPVGPGALVDPVFPGLPGHGAFPGGGAFPGHGDGRGHADDCECRTTYIPPHTVCREETVRVPAVYDDRCVPVYDVRCVPIYETVCVPVTAWVTDPRTGRRQEVVVGERKEQVQVGERKERVQVGERHERVLVTPETTRVVTRHELVPGRRVTICDGGRHHHAGETLTSEAYGREVASLDPAPHRDFERGAPGFLPRGDGAGAGGRHGAGRGEGRTDDGWYTGDHR